MKKPMRMREYQLKSPFSDPAPRVDPTEVGSEQRVSDPFASTDSRGLGGSGRKVLTVSELSRDIQFILESQFASVWVEGEVSQPTISTKGHMYFSLKDANALIKCVVWREAAQAIRFNMEHGLKVICHGRVSLYPPRGDYQLYVEQVEPKGMGALQLAFEQLKEKLQKEGLFADERKRPLPIFPERIGVVTSPTGAAIQDILKVLDGCIHVYLRPVRVQGDGAAEAVAQAIAELNKVDGLDLLIIGRGGGSLEDLWAFNAEIVARAIAASKLPVISAVGHEKDVTISDLVADLRAPTPTRSAEMVVACRALVIQRFLAILDEDTFTQPEEWLENFQEQLEEIQQGLVEGLREPLMNGAHRLRVLHSDVMACSPQSVIVQQAECLRRLRESLGSRMNRSLEQLAAEFSGLSGRLHALSPLAVLDRGYSITFDPHGKILKEARSVKSGDRIQTRLHNGRVTSRVESTEATEQGEK